MQSKDILIVLKINLLQLLQTCVTKLYMRFCPTKNQGDLRLHFERKRKVVKYSELDFQNWLYFAVGVFCECYLAVSLSHVT